MQYAVIETGGKQYRVSENSEILIDRIKNGKDEQVIFDKVLLVRTGDDIQLGSPYLPNVKVVGKVSDHPKGNKIRVAKFKAKVRYRRSYGFRAAQTRVLIEEIKSAAKSGEK